jgi:hypothetical protein
MRNDPRDKVESLMDDALASYARQEPRPGLEQRVLARIHADTAPRRAIPRWTWVIPAAACLLCAGVFWSRHAGTPEQSKPAQVIVRATAPPRPETPQTPRIVQRVRKRKVLPRLPQFPAPAPVTNEERALLAFVAQAPKEAREALTESEQQRVEPIRIEEIKIEPLP